MVQKSTPELAAWGNLRKVKFHPSAVYRADGTLTTRGAACRAYAPCLRGFIAAQEPHLDTLLRIQNGGAEAHLLWKEEFLQRAKQTPTAVLFGLSNLHSRESFSDPEVTLLHSVLVAQQTAVRNGWVFCGFLWIAFAILATIRALSPRFRPATYD